MAVSDYQFRLNPTDLLSLCRDRKLRTVEIHKSNDFYGHATLLKRYMGLPPWYSLKVVIEHSLILYDYVWDYDRDEALPMVLTRSQKRGDVIQHECGKPAIPVGFTSLYAIELYQRRFGEFANRPRHGTIVFPYKSSMNYETHFDHSDYAGRLKALPNRMKPIVVCIYWKDFLRGVHRVYQQQGFQVVTAGHIYDKEFYLRLYDICRQFKYAVSNEFGTGTQVCVPVSFGCCFSFVKSTRITRTYQGKTYDLYESDSKIAKVRPQAMELFAEPVDKILPEQQAFVDEILGTRFLKTPKQLRRIIGEAEWLDKFRILPSASEAFENHVRTTPFLQRRLRRVLKLGRSIKKRLPRFVRRRDLASDVDATHDKAA